MTDVLEEMIRKGERYEPTILENREEGIEDAYHFAITPIKMQYYAKKFFRKEHDSCEELRDIINSMKEPATYIYVRTDSSAVNNYKAVYGHIKEHVLHLGFDECDVEIPLIEAYKNSIIHVGGGEEKDYGSREGAKRPSDWEENSKNPIEIEMMLSKGFYILRITDCGKGFDVPKIQPGMDGNVMAFEGRGLKMISGLTDCMIGNHQYYPQRFALSIIKYKDSPSKKGECIVRL